MIHEVASYLQSTRLAEAIRGGEGWEWSFPIIEIVHVLALAVAVGTILAVDLRLLGITLRETRVSRLVAELTPLTWGAWVLALASGSLMFISKAVTYAGDPRFQWKFILMGLAGVNMLVFHKGAYASVAQWDAGAPPAAARRAGAISIALWIAIVFLGRYVGFYV